MLKVLAGSDPKSEPLRLHIHFLLVLACTISPGTHAEDRKDTVTTPLQLDAQHAKAAHLRSQVNDLVAMVKAKQLAAAGAKAAELRKAYEATFTAGLRQYTFQSEAEFNEFRKSAGDKFEWIDWGYKECLQMQAFLAVERKDFASGLAILKSIELVAPISAGTAIETGYVLNQLGKPDEGLSAYRRAHAISVNYASQRPYRAMALRGMGVALIDLHQLDEAERVLFESLEIEPGNQVALHELAYIRDLRGSK